MHHHCRDVYFATSNRKQNVLCNLHLSSPYLCLNGISNLLNSSFQSSNLMMDGKARLRTETKMSDLKIDLQSQDQQLGGLMTDPVCRSCLRSQIGNCTWHHAGEMRFARPLQPSNRSEFLDGVRFLSASESLSLLSQGRCSYSLACLSISECGQPSGCATR